jgi:hypothetical protein
VPALPLTACHAVRLPSPMLRAPGWQLPLGHVAAHACGHGRKPGRSRRTSPAFPCCLAHTAGSAHQSPRDWTQSASSPCCLQNIGGGRGARQKHYHASSLLSWPATESLCLCCCWLGCNPNHPRHHDTLAGALTVSQLVSGTSVGSGMQRAARPVPMEVTTRLPTPSAAVPLLRASAVPVFIGYKP